MSEEKEVWKDIQGFNGKYRISNLGRVVSIKKTIPPTLMNPCLNGAGYYVVRLSLNNKAKNFLLHRLIAESFIPNPQNKPHIDHIDGNPKNNAISNLRWVTPKENMNNPIALERHRVKNRDNEHINRLRATAYNSRKVAKLDCKGNIINVFISQSEAARTLNINISAVNQRCNKYKGTKKRQRYFTLCYYEDF